MNRSLFSVISGGYGLLKSSHKIVDHPRHKKYVEWKLDDTIQVISTHLRVSRSLIKGSCKVHLWIMLPKADTTVSIIIKSSNSLVKRSMIVNYDSRAVLTRKLPKLRL